MSRAGWLRTMTFFALPLMAGPASAQTSVELTDATLEELMRLEIVTASRVSEPLGEASARMHVITEAQIRLRGYRSLTDLLKDFSDFKVDLAGDPDHPVELTVQGSRGAGRVMLLLDGVRVSSPTNEPLPILANYPLHSAKQVEILYGPASAVYGADAFSAIINIITNDADDDLGFSAETSLGQYGLSNHNASYTARVGRSGSLMVGGQFLYDGQPDLSTFYPAEFGGLRGQRTGTFNTSFGPMQAVGPISPEYDIPVSARSLQAHLRFGGLQLSLFENQSRTPTAPANTPDNAVYNADSFNQNSLIVTSGSYMRDIGRVGSTSTLTLSRHQLDPESGHRNTYSSMRRSYKYAYGSMMKAEEQLVWKPSERAIVTTGATFERFFAIPQGAHLNAPVGSRNTPGTILGTTIVDEFNTLRYSNAGVYAQLQQRMSTRLTATLGGRADYNTRFGATFNPRLGLVVKPNTNTTMKVLYGTAYLAPTPYQAYAHYGSFYSTDGGETYASRFWHLPNPNLKPQRKQSLEVNLMQGLGLSFALSASSFYSYVADTIKESDRDLASSGFYQGWPVAYIEFPVNGGDEATYGGTIGLDFVRSLALDGHINLRAALSLVDGRMLHQYPDRSASRLQIGGMTPVQFRLGVDARLGDWSVAPRLTVSGPQRLRVTETILGSTRRRRLDGYSTVDMNVRRSNVFKELDMFVMVENAFDARYRHINMRAYSSPQEFIGVPQNPRRLTIGAQIQIR